MKKLITFCLMGLFISLQAQQVNDYQYIIVPEKFSEFKANEHQLNILLKQLLTKKNYKVLSDKMDTWPDEVKANPCLALKTDLVKETSWRKNIVNLIFTRCNDAETIKFNGSSNIKEFKEGYQDALRLAMDNVRFSVPKKLDEMVAVVNPPKLPEGNISTNSVVEVGMELKNNQKIYVLTELKDGSYVLIQKENSTIIANLRPATKNGVYHVTIQEGSSSYHTIGYFDGKTLSIEYLNSDKSYRLTEFKK